jgi:hypothetical protein
MCRLPLGHPISPGAVTKIEAILEIPAGRWWLPQDDFKKYGLSYLDGGDGFTLSVGWLLPLR